MRRPAECHGIVRAKNAEGEGAIDDGGWFFGADADDGPGRLAFGEEAASIGGAKLCSRSMAERKDSGVSQETASRGPARGAQITAAGKYRARWGCGSRDRDEGEGLRFGLAEAMGFEAEGIAARLDGGDGADEIAVLGPEMEEAAAVVGGRRSSWRGGDRKGGGRLRGWRRGDDRRGSLRWSGRARWRRRRRMVQRGEASASMVRARCDEEQEKSYQPIRFRNSTMWAVWWRQCQA